MRLTNFYVGFDEFFGLKKNKNVAFNLKSSSKEDYKSLRKDWLNIGKDIKNATRKYSGKTIS